MKSNLNLLAFKKRLTALTSEEKGFYFITPYNPSGTPFCGTYNESSFELTRNSFWTHAKAFVIKGEYKSFDHKSTEVTYEIGWRKFMRNLFIVFNVLAFIGINTVAIVNTENFDTSLLSILLTLNGFLIVGNLWVFMTNWVTKRIINQRFKEEFEIEDVEKN